MSNYKAITGSSKIVHRNQGGGSKLQGIPSTTNLNAWAHVAFRNRNVVCPCNRNLIFCMNQLGGVGAGGIPGRSYAFAPSADGSHKQFYCGHIIAKYPDKVFFGIIPNPSPSSDDAPYPTVAYTFPLVINNTYKVIINNKESTFKIIKFIGKTISYYYYKIHVINSGNIRDNGLVYKSGVLFDNDTNTVIKQNDTSFQLSVQ